MNLFKLFFPNKYELIEELKTSLDNIRLQVKSLRMVADNYKTELQHVKSVSNNRQTEILTLKKKLKT